MRPPALAAELVLLVLHARLTFGATADTLVGWQSPCSCDGRVRVLVENPGARRVTTESRHQARPGECRDAYGAAADRNPELHVATAKLRVTNTAVEHENSEADGKAPDRS